MKCPLPIALGEEGYYDLINVLCPFSVILQPSDFYYEVQFTYTPSAGKAARKVIKYFDQFGFQIELESCKSVPYSWVIQIFKSGNFSGSTVILVVLI